MLKAEIERVIRERLVEDRGSEALAKSVRKPLPKTSTSCTPIETRWPSSSARFDR